MLFGVLVIAVIVLIMVVQMKRNKKKGSVLLGKYMSQGGDYLAAMENDLDELLDKKAKIDPIVKEYESKRQYITKTYEAERRSVSRYYSQLEQSANKAGDVHGMSQARMLGKNECSAIFSKQTNELEMLKASYSDVLTAKKEVDKKIVNYLKKQLSKQKNKIFYFLITSVVKNKKALANFCRCFFLPKFLQFILKTLLTYICIVMLFFIYKV